MPYVRQRTDPWAASQHASRSIEACLSKASKTRPLRALLRKPPVTQISMRNSRLHRHAGLTQELQRTTGDDPWRPSRRRTHFCRPARLSCSPTQSWPASRRWPRRSGSRGELASVIEVMRPTEWRYPSRRSGGSHYGHNSFDARAACESRIRITGPSSDRRAPMPSSTVGTDLSATETPERFVLSLGRHFTVEPNLFEQVRTDFHEQSALKPGDLLIYDALQLLVVAPAKDTPPLVVDLAGG
jgi:hypothetical protein